MTVDTRAIFTSPHSLPVVNIGWLPIVLEKSLQFPSFGLYTPLDLKRAKILLVGDIAKEKTTALLLQSWNAQVDKVKDVLEMIEKVYHQHYKLIMIDLQMPIMDGWEAANFIRMRLRKQTPLIALSSTILDFDQKTLKIAGFNGYLYKPIRPQILRNLINMLNINETSSNDEEDTEQQLSIDVDFIKNLTGGDVFFVREIIRLYEEQTNEILQKLPPLLSTQGTKGIGDLVHKFKSSCNSVGNLSLYQLCSQIEKETRKSDSNWAFIKKRGEELIAGCHKIMEEMPQIEELLSE